MNYDSRAWAVHRGSTHAFDRPAPHVDNGALRPDPERYVSRAFAAEEWEKVFTQAWLLAGPSSDVREAGDWMKYDIGPESFIVVRKPDGGLAAHYNVCPHRGSQLVQGDVGCQDDFT
ncbi:MAG: Rieske 2Fe-2S domain-containing protein, partial [Alphaproteobacteria bacterium]